MVFQLQGEQAFKVIYVKLCTAISKNIQNERFKTVSKEKLLKNMYFSNPGWHLFENIT